MNRLLITIISLFLALSGYSQELRMVKFSGATTLSSFAFVTDQQVVIKISDDGKVLEWGIDAGPGRYGYAPGTLQPYLGRVEYFGTEYDSSLSGKVKSIGTCWLNYYGKYDIATKIGKLKSIGRVELDYYPEYENPALRGKLQFAGSIVFGYYSAYDNEAFRGKLKSVGNTAITYFSTYDDQLVRGKIKSVGSINYTWQDRGFRGGGYTVTMTPIFNGITFIIL